MNKKIGRKANINLKIDYLSKEKLLNIAQEQKINLEELLVAIIKKYLEEKINDPTYLNHQKLEKIKHNFQQLEQRLILLEKEKFELKTIDNRISILEKKVQNLQNLPSPHYITKFNNYYVDDDIDDEPDEILTEFLD